MQYIIVFARSSMLFKFWIHFLRKTGKFSPSIPKRNDIYIKNSEYQVRGWISKLQDFRIIGGQGTWWKNIQYHTWSTIGTFLNTFPITNFTEVASQLQISIMKIKIIISLTKKLTENAHNQQNYTKENDRWQQRIFQLMNIVEHKLIPDEGS